MTDRLDVRVGNAPGASFRLRVVGGELTEDTREGATVVGHIDHFDRVAVISGRGGAFRYFELTPGDTETSLELGGFYVRGRFNFARKENNARRAREAWEAFRATSVGSLG